MNKILDLVNQGRVFEINQEMLGERNMSKEEMKAIFNHFNAFWQYDGPPTPEKPHARLKSEKHSNGFIACREVLKYPRMCELFAGEIGKHLAVYYDLSSIDVVVSSAYSAITLGYEVARFISKFNPEIEYVEVEKDYLGNPTVIRGGIDPSKTVLVVNELMTTGSGSTWQTRDAVLKCNTDKPAPGILDDSFVLVLRSKEVTLADKSGVIPVFHFDINDWSEEECPYCKAGSKAIKPKVENNWNIIHGKV